MRKILDLTGQRFGKLVAEKFAGQEKSGKALWLCRCDCGKTRTIRSNDLRMGRASSCGCARLGKTGEKGGTRKGHGMFGTPTYSTWAGAIQRCTNPNHPAYRYYGGRGISICDRWRDFANFLADMGERPKGLSLDRIDNDGPYSPDNCRWATRHEQANNMSKNRRILVEGELLTLAEAARKIGLPIGLVTVRASRGHSDEEIISTKHLRKSKRSK